MAILSPNLEAAMGRVATTLAVANAIDLVRASRGEIDAASIRSVTLEGVLVDTGATYLSLPVDLVAQLDLLPLRDVSVGTAAGPRPARILGNAVLTVMGRRATVDVLELPAGVPPLLGVIPMEALGLEPDLMNQQLRLLPDGPADTYVTAL